LSRALWLAVLLALACRGEPRGPCHPSPPPGELGSICGFENPEDVEPAAGRDLLLVSQMRHEREGNGGSLAALPLAADGEPLGPPRRLWPDGGSTAPDGAARDPGCGEPPAAERFSPHGLATGVAGADGEIPVAVVGHGAREAIELFALRGAGADARLRWRGCVPLPPGAIGNDVVVAADGALLVTHFQPSLSGASGLFYTVAGGLGFATGEVLRWRAGEGWSVVPGTRGANPNGLLLSPDGATLYVAFTGARSVGIRPLSSAGAPHDVAVTGHPDNLSAGPDGTLYAAVHGSGLAVLLCRFGARPCRSPWLLLEIDPASRAARRRLEHDGSRVGSVASAARVGRRLYFGAVFDDRMGTRRLRADPAARGGAI
jgi:hypothetical protein